MGVLKDLVDSCEKAINEHGSATILKERLDFLRERADALEQDNVTLKARVSELEQLVRDLRGQLQAKSIPEDFVEHKGVYWKRNPKGGFFDTVYCFDCKKPMSSLVGELPYHCKCGFSANFAGNQLAAVMRGLPA